jgi:hypothetical protein
VAKSQPFIVGEFHPKLAIIGGRLEDDNAAIYDEMRRMSGGRIVVFATASSVPDEVGPETVGVFSAYGFDAVLAGVHGPGAALAAKDQAIADLVEAVRRTQGRALLEASGGLTLDTAAEVAATGVDYLAVGALTHSAPVLDIGADLRPEE